MDKFSDHPCYCSVAGPRRELRPAERPLVLRSHHVCASGVDWGKPQDEVEIEFPYGKMGTSSFLLLVAMASTLNI